MTYIFDEALTFPNKEVAQEVFDVLAKAKVLDPKWWRVVI